MSKKVTDSEKDEKEKNALTAEWTVRAKLTISGPGEKVTKEFTSNDPENPVRVTCKWTNLDENETKTPSAEHFTDSGQCSPQKGQNESFYSTNSTLGDFGDSVYSSKSPSKSPRKDVSSTRCHTTCNIILSAVADFPYTHANDCTEHSKPTMKTTFHTTANKSYELRDAFSQTSDTESKAFDDFFVNKNKVTPKSYDHRRYTTDALLRPSDFVDGDNLLSPPGTITPPFSRVPPLPDEILSPNNESQKKPRTVHIDVYCTGSETDDADVENSSLSSDGNRMELDSNSTPQTVLNNEEMMIHHKRINTKEKLPRRFLRNNQPEVSGCLKSDTADEILESKNMLFRKHMGDTHLSTPTRRHRTLTKNPSEDYPSSGYANSTRSTQHDPNSSTSSNVPSHEIESSWKETDHEIRMINKSDSFEYDNIRDRMRIKQMEKYWGIPEIKPGKESDPTVIFSHLLPNHNLATISEKNNRPTFNRNDTLLSDGTDIFLTIDTTPERDMSGNERKYNLSPDFFLTPTDTSKSASHSPITVRPTTLERWKSEARDTLATSSVPQTPNSPGLQRSFSQRWNRSTPPKQRPTNIEFSDRASVASTVASNISGYTNEYLQKASRFGSVVTSTRKPGHHVGPTKNPNCQCEHCQRWLSTRFSVAGRGRAYSVGDSPGARGKFIINRN